MRPEMGDTIHERTRVLLMAMAGDLPIPGVGLLLKHKVLPSLASISDDDLAETHMQALELFAWALNAYGVVDATADPGEPTDTAAVG